MTKLEITIVTLSLVTGIGLMVHGLSGLSRPNPSPLEKALQATVEIRTWTAEGEAFIAESTGSGTMVDKRGYIVTCWHVVRDTDRIVVEWNGTHASAHVIAHDEDLDLALVKIERLLPYVATWGDSEKLKAGDPVYAVGYPFDISLLVRTGIVSSTNYTIADNQFIVTDAAVNPGDSGGGLYTHDGAFIGIPARILSVGGPLGNIGLAYAIPSDIAHQFVLRFLPKE